MSSAVLTIEKRAANLANQVEQKQELESHLQLLKIFQTRSIQLEESLITLVSVCNVLANMRQMAITCPPLDEIVKSIVPMVREKQLKFKSSPDWIVDLTSSEFAPFLKKVNHAIETIRQQLLKAWQEFLDANIPKVQSETLATFRKIKAFQDDISEIEQHLLALMKLRGQLPANGDIEKAIRKCEQIRTLWSKFGQGNVPNEVLEFLRLAGSTTGAPVRPLTGAVRSWLISQGIFDGCTIKI